jgi:DNA mismatch repair protein MSH2
MAEMIEAAHLLSHATRNSLLIIDELGRGTSTNDGFGLAWAISEYLIEEKQCFTIFATHFHELTSLPKLLQHDGVCNKHVAAYVNQGGSSSSSNSNNSSTSATVTYLHEVRDGPCNDSYGINIAEIAGFPSHVIKNAREKLLRLEKFSGFDIQQEEQRKRLKMNQQNQNSSSSSTDDEEAIMEDVEVKQDLDVLKKLIEISKNNNNNNGEMDWKLLDEVCCDGI